MPTVTTTIPEDTAGKIKRNAELALKQISSYVVVIASALAAVWMGMSETERQAFVAAHPVLAPLSPYVALVTFAIAKLLPQNIKLSADEKARVDALEAELNAYKARELVKQVQAKPEPVSDDDGFADTQHVDLPMPTQAAAVTTMLASTLGDPWPALRQNNPGKTDAQILAIVQATAVRP